MMAAYWPGAQQSCLGPVSSNACLLIFADLGQQGRVEKMAIQSHVPTSVIVTQIRPAAV